MNLNIKRTVWKKSRDKVWVKHLARDNTRDFQLDLIKLEPNTTYTSHRHPDAEWVYVLKGGFTDESGSFGEGDFKINEKHSEHTIKTPKSGCILFVCWCGRLEE